MGCRSWPPPTPGSASWPRWCWCGPTRRTPTPASAGCARCCGPSPGAACRSCSVPASSTCPRCRATASTTGSTGDRGQGVCGRLRDRGPVRATGDLAAADLDGPARARRRLHRGAGDQRRTDRRRDGRVVGTARRTGRGRTGRRGRLPARPRAGQGHAVQRRGPGPGRRTSTWQTWDACGPRADLAEGWTALLEAAAKAVRAMLVSVPAPREIVVSGRLARAARAVARLAGRLATSLRWRRSCPAAPARPRTAARSWPMRWRAAATPRWPRC